MKPEITILVPKFRKKYKTKTLEMLLRMHNVKSKTVLNKEARGTNYNLFINIGDEDSFKGMKSQFKDNYFITIGYFQSQAWIFCESDHICCLDDDSIKKFIEEYKVLISYFRDKIEIIKNDEIHRNYLKNLLGAFCLTDPFLYLMLLMGGKDCFTGGVKGLWYETKGKTIPIEHRYSYAILKFVHDYLDDFLKDNGFVKEGENVYVTDNKDNEATHSKDDKKKV